MAKKSFLLSERFLSLNPSVSIKFTAKCKLTQTRQFHHICQSHSRRLWYYNTHSHRVLHISTLSDEAVPIRYVGGLPQLSVRLPSRNEPCQFTLRPFNNTVADLISQIQQEDRGVDRVALYSTEGTKIAKSTPIDILLQSSFEIVINDKRYAATPPAPESAITEHATQLEDVKRTVSQLFSTLHVEQFQLQREQLLLARLETLKQQIEPYEKIIQDIESKANIRLKILAWAGLGFMGLQFGFLARLTWWEYSWDIMEPVTYFINLAYATIFYAYYVLTKQEYSYRDAYNREYLMTLHRAIVKRGEKLDINEYNRLKHEIADCETDLRRLRDPLQVHLPISQLPGVPFKHHTMD